MSIWFTSDCHFTHRLMLKTRNFNTLEEHDEIIMQNWNKNIKKLDEVYFLGDFCFSTQARAQNIFDRLNGRIYWIRGNHDNPKRIPSGYVWFKDVYKFKFDKQIIWLSHYPHMSWPHSSYKSLHLFGHVHGTIPMQEGRCSFDVGMDAWNLHPISLDQVLEIYNNLKA